MDVYKLSPTCELKYIIELGEIVKYPNKIIKEGYGNDDFNNGLNSSEYAYEIKYLDDRKNIIPFDKIEEFFKNNLK